MKILSILGSIAGAFGKVMGVGASVFKIARPLAEALSPAIEEVDVALDWLETNAVVVGEGADDFLDRNLKTITDLEAFSGRGAVVFGKLNELAAGMRIASQEVTPDIIDEAEATRLIGQVGELQELIAAWKPEMATFLASMKVAEAEMDAG